MTLRKKIILSFIISASIIASLVVFESVNYVRMRKQITFLELTDTIRSKSLQLRRHEKNFFLYGPSDTDGEVAAIESYVEELRSIVDDNLRQDKTGRLLEMDAMLDDYVSRFHFIRREITELTGLLEKNVPLRKEDRRLYPIIGLTFVERPLAGEKFLRENFGLTEDSELAAGLRKLDSEIRQLRKDGEDIIDISKELDASARADVDRTITVSQTAAFIFLPIFILVGTVTLLLIAGNMTRRLNALEEVVDHAGRGDFAYVPEVFRGARKTDELGLVVGKFLSLGGRLAERERELEKKNEELLQTKKLAAIGTLAAGVAHELNNPLNNIYISAQVLKRQTRKEQNPVVTDVVEDIVGQTARVKRIVGDLLAFARMNEPAKQEEELVSMIKRAHSLAATASSFDPAGVEFMLTAPEGGVTAEVDPSQMERVFINLCANAIDAMHGEGTLTVDVSHEGDGVAIVFADTGEGMDKDMLDKVFEPFYTTKERGTGLGLSICYNIIKRHGGELFVASVKGEGTRFTIKLPAGKA